MRPSLRLLAAVKPARYLEAGAPTGLTGLLTHASPRSALIYLYRSTLDKLQAVPEHSVYRQSVEALTKHRLAIVEAVEPAGHAEWAEKALKLLEDQPELLGRRADGTYALEVQRTGGKHGFFIREIRPKRDDRDTEWDGEVNDGPTLEGTRTKEERAGQHEMIMDMYRLWQEAKKRSAEGTLASAELEPEPKLTAEQYVFLHGRGGDDSGLREQCG